jgi:hypothetical protein
MPNKVYYADISLHLLSNHRNSQETTASETNIFSKYQDALKYEFLLLEVPICSVTITGRDAKAYSEVPRSVKILTKGRCLTFLFSPHYSKEHQFFELNPS